MIFLTLQIAESSDETGRYDGEENFKGWANLASSQAGSEAEAKALMLDNVLEMLNNEDLLPSNEWLRLVYYGDDHMTITKVEVF